MESSLYFSSIQLALTTAVADVLRGFIGFIPQLISAGLVLLLGVFCARWAKWLTIKVLEALRLSSVIKNSPFEKFVERAELTSKIEIVCGNIVRWFVLLIFVIAVLNLLGLTTVSHFLSNILGYIPNIIAAVLILTLGVLVAGFVESLVKSSLSQISRSTGRMASKLASYMIMVFTILAAFAQLGIAHELINTLFIGFVAMLALGFGLAFGLGAKDLVAKILDEWYENLKKDLK